MGLSKPSGLPRGKAVGIMEFPPGRAGHCHATEARLAHLAGTLQGLTARTFPFLPGRGWTQKLGRRQPRQVAVQGS